MDKVGARLPGTKASLVALAIALTPAAASAQYLQFLSTDPTLVRTAVPEGFERGRNVSVVEQPRPNFDPTGIPVSSFNLFPKVDVAVGATDNVFLRSTDKKSDGYVSIMPGAELVSDWSRHKLDVTANGNIEQYFSQSRRNQEAWNVDAKGELELGDDIKIMPEAAIARQFESPYSGDTQSANAVLSNYLTSYLALRGQYQAGRVRGILAVDRSSFSFSDLDFGNDVEVSQGYRDRVITRGSGQAEYAFSPTISAYAQVIYDDISYDETLFGQPNRSSNGYHATIGANFDISGFLRGTLGIGYVRRDYNSSLYKSVDGVSAEARLEYFASELTTVTLRLRRFLEDSSIGNNIPFFDNRVSLRVDHAILQNLLVNATGEYGHLTYVGLSDKRDNYRFAVGGQYMATRRYGLKGIVSYGSQTSDDASIGASFKEARGQIGFYFQI